MAAVFCKSTRSRLLLSLALTPKRFASTRHGVDRKLFWKIACGCVGGTILSVYTFCNVNSWTSSTGCCLPQLHAKTKDKQAVVEDTKKSSLQAAREMRFLHFASIEYDDNIYMTPQDFLESVAEDKPRPRTARRQLNEAEVRRFLKKTPKKKDMTTHLFRDLHNGGLISYTEYLFLLCVLTKPRSGFQIAFNMFDMDGNQKMDRNEFLVMEKILLNNELVEICPKAFKRSEIAATARISASGSNIWTMLEDRACLEEIMTRSSTTTMTGGKDDKKNKAASGPCDTTLTVHFFGENGKDVLQFHDFHRFMENLQTEVLELEFNEFSHGMPTITEEQFARILLRYTTLKQDDHSDYLDRLRNRIPDVKGVTFKDFKEFCQFLNSLDDLALAMRMYAYTDKPISQDEFQRAVKACTGNQLSKHVVHVVFQLFDSDGDGHLSRKEFISVMKDRLHRGFRSHPMDGTRWQSFKNCVKTQMKNQ